MESTLSIDAVLVTDIPVNVRNMNAGGVQLEARVHLPIGTLGLLALEFAGESRLEWIRICRTQTLHGHSSVEAVGAEFLPLAVADERSLRGAIRHFAPRPAFL